MLAWANRHLVGLLFSISILIMLWAIFLEPTGPRQIAQAVAFVIVIAALITRARRRPRPLPPAPPAPPAKPSDHA